MIALGFLLYLLNQAFSSILPFLLPLIYGAVILMGILMLLGRNPFNRLALAQAPALKSPAATAFVYGMFLAPMTLPCTGPLIISAFVLGANDTTTLLKSLFYFLSFGIGFGWPLIVLALIAAPVQRHFSSWLTRHHTLVTRLSGLLLIGIGALGVWTDFIQR